MFNIYLYEGQIDREEGETLVKQAALAYCQERGIAIDCDCLEILRRPQGKPYFVNLPIEFNISHSGQMWVCIMGQGQCGIDIQEIRECNFKKLAGRYFSREEQSFVLKNGLEGFFCIWAMREALAKYTGRGLFGEKLPSVVDEEGKLKDFVIYHSNEGEVPRKVFIRQLFLSSEIKCAYCNEEEKDEIKIIG